MMTKRPILPFLAAAALALSGCGGLFGKDDGNVEALDSNLAAANVQDAALTAALHDQIMVDPRLSQQANGDAIRPPSQPYAAPVPAADVATNGEPLPAEQLMHAPAPTKCDRCQNGSQAVTLGGLASRQSSAGMRGCAAGLQYSATWANRLPQDLPLYPRAHVSEAAGAGGSCRLRIVSFSTTQPLQTLVDWYYTRAMKAGYNAEHQADGRQHVLGGTRGRDGGAYMIYFTDRADGGTDVDLIANNGI
jgi:hypothetical protein